MQRFGGNPQVAMEAALRKDSAPEVRRQWLEAFKQSDPANSMPNYWLALEFFKTGQTDQAVQELLTASSKPQFVDYARERTQQNEQAYVAAGYSAGEAKAIAPLQQVLYWASGADDEVVDAVFPLFRQQQEPLQQTKALCQNLVELAKSYQQSGDSASAQSILQMGVDFAERYRNSSSEDGLSQAVGDAAEILELAHMDPATPYGSDGQTVQDRIAELRQQRKPLRSLYLEIGPLLGMMSDQDWASYTEKSKLFGEPAALQWVVGKYGGK